MKKIIVLIIISALVVNSALALYGTRPSGMGGAFTAVADDANAPYWNAAGLALNPEVSLTGSMRTNNRNTSIGDNTANLKLCYETEMNPFLWIAGVGIASAIALAGAEQLKNNGTLQTNWGKPGAAFSREASVVEGIDGSEKTVSLKQQIKEEVKDLAKSTGHAVKETAKDVAQNTDVNVNVGVGLLPYSTPWYQQAPNHPSYWERPRDEVQKPSTKAQFALGLSLMTDNNPPMDQKSNWYSVTVATGFEQRVAFGMGANFYDLTKISTDVRGLGGDLDLGVIVRPVTYITLGLAARGVLTSGFHWQNGQVTRGYEMTVNAGLAAKPVQALTLAVDSHNLLNQNGGTATMHYGAELTLLPGLLARAGLDNNNKTAGLSVAVGSLIVDYAYLGGSYSRTQMVGATWRF